MSELGVNMRDLATAVDWSNRQMSIHRENRVAAIKQFVGGHYAENGSAKVVPTNFLELAVTIYTRQLAARAPAVMVSTPYKALRPQALQMELALNQIPGEINLGATLRRLVIEALFSCGITKTGISSSGVSVLGREYGTPFVDLVTIDDYFCDMTAKSRDAMQYEGNDYWLPVDDAQAMWNNASGLEPDPHTLVNEHGDTRADSVSSGEGADLYREKLWLRDVWLPQTGQLVTYAVTSKRVLNIIDWDGPDTGPYNLLGFSEVPGNLLPLPPVALWRDLHELGNALFRKLGRQAEAKKTLAGVTGGNDDDVEAIKKAKDGEGVRVGGAKIEKVEVGGIDGPTLAFYLQSRDLFSYFAGNLDALGGLSPMADTVGQEKLVSEAASARVNHMRSETVSVTKGIFKALAWYEWTDPVRERFLEITMPGTDFSSRRRWSAETRDGDFLDYAIDIDPYSMQEDTPTIRLQKIGQALERFVFPILPMIQEQGGQIDMHALLSLVGKLGNVPELEDIVKFQAAGGQMPMPPGNAQPSTKPANTHRTYERVNRPGATRSGKDDVMTRLLMGGNAQGSEIASLGRMVG